MVPDCKYESITEFFAEVVVEGVVPVLEGGLDVAVDVTVVPEEVVGDSLGEKAWVTEDREELAELGEVVGDTSAVVDGGGEILEQFSNVHNTMSNAD